MHPARQRRVSPRGLVVAPSAPNSIDVAQKVPYGYAHPTDDSVVLPNAYVAPNPLAQSTISQQEGLWEQQLSIVESSAQVDRMARIPQMFPDAISPNRLDHSRQVVAFVTGILDAVNERHPHVVISRALTQAGALAHDIGHPTFGHLGEDALSRYAASLQGFRGSTRFCHNEFGRTITEGLAIDIGDVRVDLPALDLHPYVLDIVTAHSWPTRSGKTLEHNLMKLSDRVPYACDDYAWGIFHGLISSRDELLVGSELLGRDVGPLARRNPAELSRQLQALFIDPVADAIGRTGVAAIPVEYAARLQALRDINTHRILLTDQRAQWHKEASTMLCTLVDRVSRNPAVASQARDRNTSPAEFAIRVVASLDDTQSLALAEQERVAVPSTPPFTSCRLRSLARELA